jgi:predicted nucleotidyltransferase
LGLRQVGLRTWHWRRRRQARDDARRTAQAVIARARQPGAHGDVERDGNVLRPESFQRPRKPH